MTERTQIRNKHQISDEWECYEYYDEGHDRWRWSLLHTPSDQGYAWMAGCGMPVEEITPDACDAVTAMLDDQDCNVCLFHPFSQYVEWAMATTDDDDDDDDDIELDEEE